MCRVEGWRRKSHTTSMTSKDRAVLLGPACTLLPRSPSEREQWPRFKLGSIKSVACRTKWLRRERERENGFCSLLRLPPLRILWGGERAVRQSWRGGGVGGEQEAAAAHRREPWRRACVAWVPLHTSCGAVHTPVSN
jgi:hypothetical protein